jgi:hypothetical protein
MGVGVEALADLIVGLLHESNGNMHASICCEHLYDLDPAYKPLLKRIGGIKGLCSRHSERLQYVGNAGGGMVRLGSGKRHVLQKQQMREDHEAPRLPAIIEGGAGLDREVDRSEYPIRPGEPDCSFFRKSGACKIGKKCKFNHPQPQRLSADTTSNNGGGGGGGGGGGAAVSGGQGVVEGGQAGRIGGGLDPNAIQKGGIYWYRDTRDGVEKQVEVVAIDRSVRPPSFAIRVDGRERETEAHRLSLHQSSLPSLSERQGSVHGAVPAAVDADWGATSALNTVDVTLISHTHGRERRAERSIGRVDLQAAVKHGNREAASPGQRGEQRWRYEYNGVVYITDASSKHEITSWRLDGKDVLKDARDAQLYGTHILLVVDNSGSMRKGDVPGYRSRTDAVYASLLRDLVLPQLKQGSAEAESQIVVSLIEMSDDAHVLLEKVPLDEELARSLTERRENYAHSHGNYLPSLSKVVQLLSASRESSRLMLVFLSDGAPSDYLFRECAHGVQVWQLLENSEKPKQQRGKQVMRTCSALSEKGEKCRSAVQKSVNDECLKSIAHLGRTCGTDRVIVAAQTASL